MYSSSYNLIQTTDAFGYLDTKPFNQIEYPGSPLVSFTCALATSSFHGRFPFTHVIPGLAARTRARFALASLFLWLVLGPLGLALAT